MHYKYDYLRAKQEEVRILPYVKEFFSRPDIAATDGQYAQYDYTCPAYNYEVKNRFDVKRDQYEETMITSDKLFPTGDYEGKPVVLIFNFADYLCYINYDSQLFSEFREQSFSRAKQSWDEKPHTYIPVKYLKTILKWSDLRKCDNCCREYPNEMMGWLDGQGQAPDLFYCPICCENDFIVEYI